MKKICSVIQILLNWLSLSTKKITMKYFFQNTLNSGTSQLKIIAFTKVFADLESNIVKMLLSWLALSTKKITPG